MYNQVIDENKPLPQLKRDVVYCFDLEIPFDFTPAPNDGEVKDFIY